MLPLLRTHRSTPDFFLNDFFNNDFWPGFRNGNNKLTNSSSPAVNVEENNKEFVISVAAPGLSKKDFHVSVENDTLTISSKHEENKEEKEDNFLRREFNYSTFSRSFTLPENTVVEKIKALHKNGILNITIAKEEVEVQKAKEIEIR